MTSSPFDNSDAPFDPGSMPTSSLSITKAVWYRRPWFLATVGIILVVAVSVITDLPHPISKAEDASQQNGVIKQINGDSAPCIYALTESFSFYRQELAHTLSSSNLATVKNYLLEDQTICSFASGPISDMTNIQVSDTTPGKKIDAALASVVKWLTFDGVATILDIRNYFAATPFHMNTADLIHNENLLQSDRAAVMSNVQSASTLLGVTLTPITLPNLPRLPGT
ncbi:MAG: hypothetical protein HKL85_05145 [Acidimicrobiaceae bacterium]|nr:hypothetical protein [Acidimicrobiaceae bacterium]